ncbi:MAG: AAA family ATPase [Pseudomonadota bacterium]|nr:AAA family ATPase [Pseudomonadota bacterium]
MNRLVALDDYAPAADNPRDDAKSAPLKATRIIWRDPSTIPPRRFLYGRHFARGFVSVTAAPGGVGKSSLEIAEAIAIGTGRKLLDVTPYELAPVWYMGLEDPLDEYERRVAAIVLHYGIPGDEIEAALFLDSGRDQDFIIATEERNGTKIVEPVFAAIVENVRRHGIGLIIVDPFVACRAVTENDNTKLEKVTKAWARIADVTNCAVELVHHFRKSGNGGGEPTADDVRGASAIVGAVRSVRILAGMSQDQADQAGVKDHFRYFSVGFGKANLFPRSDAADWYHMASVSLGNGGSRPHDEIGVVTAWKWPNALDGLHVADLRKVQDVVAAGEWAESVQSRDWVGHAVADALGLNADDKRDKARIKSLLRTWTASGALKRDRQFNAKEGRERPVIICGART